MKERGNMPEPAHVGPRGAAAANAIVVASDHRGTELKQELRERLEAAGHAVVDVGTTGDASVTTPTSPRPPPGPSRKARRPVAS